MTPRPSQSSPPSHHRLGQATRGSLILTCAIIATVVTSLGGQAHAGFNYSEAKTDDFGDSDFGGEYYAGAHASGGSYAEQCEEELRIADVICSVLHVCISRDPASCSASGYRFEAGAEAWADVTVFGKTVNVANVNFSAAADDDGLSGSGSAYTAGFKIWSKEYSSTVQEIRAVPLYGVSKKKNFSLAGISIKVSGTAGAILILQANASASTTGLSFGGGPTVFVGADASASVEAWGAGVGVSGSLTLASLGGSANARIDWGDLSSITAKLDFDLTIVLLKGHLDLWLKLFGEKIAEIELIEFTAFDKTWNLGSITKTFQL